MCFDLKEDTSSMYGRGVLLFFTVVLNTFLGAFEVRLIRYPVGCMNLTTTHRALH